MDEAAHITFQIERLGLIYCNKNAFTRIISYYAYGVFFFSTALVVWFAHAKLFKAGHINFERYWAKMKLKFNKTIKKLKPQRKNPEIGPHLNH